MMKQNYRSFIVLPCHYFNSTWKIRRKSKNPTNIQYDKTLK